MDLELKITKVENGYILEMPTETVDSKNEVVTVIVKEVIEEVCMDEDAEYYATNDEEKIAIGKLLDRVAGYFGEMYQKYEKNNLSVKFDKAGHKYEEN